MYRNTTKANKKAVLALLAINFIILFILGEVKKDVFAYDDSMSIQSEEDDDSSSDSSDNMINVDIKSKEDLHIVEDSVEYEFIEGKTIYVSKYQAEKLEEMKQRAIEKRLEEERERKTISTSRSTEYTSINMYTDLSVMNTITADQMNEIISYWDSKSSTKFSGKGQMFIDAAKESDLDPVYILAHAALESSWGNSKIANDKNNYFGIGAFDRSPYSSSKYMGTNLYDGIVNGAKWISDKYYKRGQTSLYSMRYNNGTHEYCTSSTWVHNITDIMTRSYKIIQ